MIVFESIGAKNAFRSFPYEGRRAAFTLVELLTVMGVIAVLSAFAAPAFSHLLVGSGFDQALVQLSGSLERAREYAVSNDAYSYVGLTDVDAEGRMAIATFGAADASSGIASLVKGGDYALSAAPSASGGLQLLDRVIRVEGCDVLDAVPTGCALQSTPALATSASPLRLADSGPKFTCADGPRGTLRFTRIVQFTPDGAARVTPAVANALQLVLVPTKGDPAKPYRDIANAAAIRVAGLTGQVKIYRP